MRYGLAIENDKIGKKMNSAVFIKCIKYIPHGNEDEWCGLSFTFTFSLFTSFLNELQEKMNYIFHFSQAKYTIIPSKTSNKAENSMFLVIQKEKKGERLKI